MGGKAKWQYIFPVFLALATLTSAPWWVNVFRNHGRHSAIVGGCPSFNLYAQNQFAPLGTAIWRQPSPTSDKRHGFAPNEIVTVDGWVKAQSPYSNVNTPPWNADIWFHLSDDSGWVTFAGVRANPTVPVSDPLTDEGSDPPPYAPECGGTIRG